MGPGLRLRGERLDSSPERSEEIAVGRSLSDAVRVSGLVHRNRVEF